MSQQPPLSLEEEVNTLFEKNSVVTNIDYLFLVRNTALVPRSHTLPLDHKPSVMEHSANCVYLLDYLNTNKLITPELNYGEVNLLRDYLFYHDVSEAIVGDVPYFVSKRIKDISNLVNSEITKRFNKSSLGLTLFQLAKIIDMLEFLLSIANDPKIMTGGFDGQRLRKAYDNAMVELSKAAETCHHKVDYKSVCIKAGG